MRLWNCAAVAVASVALAGCQKYHARPLLPVETLAEVERLRRDPDSLKPASASDSPSSPVPFSFARAAELMAAHSPALKEAKAEYETALATAKVKTPLPNPSVEAGSNFAFGPDAVANRVQPFGSIGFSIPTGKRLKRQDELNFALAEAAHVDVLARHRELYMDLRKLYATLALSRARLAARRSIQESAAQSLSATKRLFQAGQATALDSGLFELEAARIQADTFSAENDVAVVEGQLSRLIGVHADHFRELPEEPLSDLPAMLPTSEELRQKLVFNHPTLARLRSKYEIAERTLRLEIARQYPDFRIGPSGQGEAGECKTTLGLTLGIDLPIFDRNQQAIATASKHRDEMRAKFEAAASNALADLDAALRSVQIAREKSKLLNTVIVPQSRANTELGRKSLEAGGSDTLRYLETQRAQRAVEIGALEAEIEAHAALTELEHAIGSPLALLPGEQEDRRPALLPGAETDPVTPPAQSESKEHE